MGMKWKSKATIQKLIDKLPSGFGDKVYYCIQRGFGALRKPKPTSRLSSGITILDYILGQGQTIESKTFLEIGTGWRLNSPIALWLFGASKIITVDLNPYLKAEMVFKDLSYIRDNQRDIKMLFGERSQAPIFQDRFNKLVRTEVTLEHLLNMANIEYLAPADATCLDLPSQSIDYHVSNNVFEHIEPDILKRIFLEGKRVLKKGGLFVHLVDFSDHYSHSDQSVSAINFLRFSKNEWNYYAGNRYGYHNRLRVDDFIDLFEKAGLKILSLETEMDGRSLEELRKGFPLDEMFRTKSQETNATVSAQIVASF